MGDPAPQKEGVLQWDFETTYKIRTYTGGCYYFNETTEIWEAVGVIVSTIGLFHQQKHNNCYDISRLKTVATVFRLTAKQIISHPLDQDFFRSQTQ